MKIIFLKDVSAQGKKGEVKEVSLGFAQNFLIAKGLAQIATPQIIAKLEKEKKDADVKRLKEIDKLLDLKNELEKRIFTIPVKVGEQGQVFGGVHEKQIAQVISEKKLAEINVSMIKFFGPLRTLGEHMVDVKLAQEITAKVKIKLVPQNLK